MIAKGSKLYSVVHQKCPQCQQGDMFVHNTASFRFAEMHKQCPACGFNFMPEPSFYFGAMYFSYAISVAVVVPVYFILKYTIAPDVWTAIGWMVAAIVAIFPLNFRWSRLAWINVFASYRPDMLKKI